MAKKKRKTTERDIFFIFKVIEVFHTLKGGGWPKKKTEGGRRLPLPIGQIHLYLWKFQISFFSMFTFPGKYSLNSSAPNHYHLFHYSRFVTVIILTRSYSFMHVLCICFKFRFCSSIYVLYLANSRISPVNPDTICLQELNVIDSS